MTTSENQDKRENYHYKCTGTAAVLGAVKPLRGKRIIGILEQKRKKDDSKFMQKVSGSDAEVKKIILIQDHLNTRHSSSFYENLSTRIAVALSQRFEMAYTPKKAIWLNMAEIKFSAFSK